jgi:peptidoglycan hydrolase-like protein with peptidoglycan-binding domain
VIGVQRALAGLGWYAWTPRERSGDVTPALDDALRRFQQDNALAVDGLANPDGETLRALASVVEDGGNDAQDDAGRPQAGEDEELPPPPPVPPQAPGESPVPPEGYLTECQKLYSVMKEAERRVEATEAFITDGQERLADLETQSKGAEAALEDKRAAEGSGSGSTLVPPKPGTPPPAALAELLLGLLARERQRKRQIEDNVENYYHSEYWAMSANQVKERVREIAREINIVEQQLAKAQKNLQKDNEKLSKAKQAYRQRCTD